jgi:hypothetical protein
MVDYDVLAQETLLYKPSYTPTYLDTEDATKEFQLAFEKGGRTIRDKSWDRVNKQEEIKKFRDNPLAAAGIPAVRVQAKDIEQDYLVNIPQLQPVPRRQWNKHLRATNERMIKKPRIPYTRQIPSDEGSVNNETSTKAAKYLRTNMLRSEIRDASYRSLDTDDIEIEVDPRMRGYKSSKKGFLKGSQMANVGSIIPDAGDIVRRVKGRAQYNKPKKVRHIPISVIFDEEDRTETNTPRGSKKSYRPKGKPLAVIQNVAPAPVFIPLDGYDEKNPVSRSNPNIKALPVLFHKITDVEDAGDRSQSITEIKEYLGMNRIVRKLPQLANSHEPDVVRLLEGEEVDPVRRVKLPNLKADPSAQRYHRQSDREDEYTDYTEYVPQVGDIRLTNQEIEVFENEDKTWVYPEPDDPTEENSCNPRRTYVKAEYKRYEKMRDSLPPGDQVERGPPVVLEKHRVNKLDKRHYEESIYAADILDQQHLYNDGLEVQIPGIKKYI